MTDRNVVHSSFVIERSLSASPERVFKAFGFREAKGRWFIGPDDWQKSDHVLEFRVGGREHLSGGPPGGPTHYFDAQFQDIVTNERIIFTYDMHLDKERISVSLATVEVLPDGSGTKLIYTEHGAFLDGHDYPDSREQGTNGLLDKLVAHLAESN